MSSFLWIKLNKIRLKEIYDFTAYGHEILSKLENSSKITIALTTGLTLGGGLELALACDYRIGTNKTQMRFPETNIGIYPGLGGTQRTVKICGVEAARYAVLAGNFLNAETANAFGLITHLVDQNYLTKTINEIVKVVNLIINSDINQQILKIKMLFLLKNSILIITLNKYLTEINQKISME